MFSKQIFLLCFLLSLLSCNNPEEGQKTVSKKDSSAPHATIDTSAQQKNDANYTIVPGQSIGLVSLGADPAVLPAIAGQPDLSDAAMGKAWMTWFGKKRDEHNNRTELNVYTAYRDSSMQGKTIQLIRSSSSAFRTPGNIHVYDALDTIGRAFPSLEYKGHFKEAGSTRILSVYDSQKDGIAFEIAVVNDQKICTAIIVHEPGKNVMDIYINFLLQRNWSPANCGPAVK
jgi:hypothetical protein